MTFANKNCEELKNLIDSLERDLKSKNNQLKSAKLEVQN